MIDWRELTAINEDLKHFAAKSKDEKNPAADVSIYAHTLALLAALRKLVELGYIKDEHLIELTAEACRSHDVGKVNAQFCKRVSSLKRLKFNEKEEVPHNVLSLFSIPVDKFEKTDYYAVAYAVLHHHKIDAKGYFKNSEQTKFINEHVRLYPEFMKPIKSTFLRAIDTNAPVNLRTLITGFLMKCDYAASGNYTIEYEAGFLEGALAQLAEKWKRDYGPKSDWNNLQKFCATHRDSNLLVVGETGLGKTEGALLWIGDGKGFFFLPIRTAINAIYDRVANGLLDYTKIESRVSLLHSNTLSYYLNNLHNLNDEELDVFDYMKRGKQLSLPLTISTIDQLFDFVFMNSGYELKLATLSYSKLVIDEIQMYDARLLAFLIHGLELIFELGGKIAILTATLPPFIADLLERKIDFKRATFTKDANPRHNIKVHNERLNLAHIVDCYRNNEKQGKSNKILVICNTIREAQRVYREITNGHVDSEHVKVFHSRFIKRDCMEKERQILEFGRTLNEDGTLYEASGIWITTSICEASLDIDFDYLFTELQYLTSLLQRLGRCNRKGVKDTSSYNCHVYTEIDEGLLEFKKGRGFIDSQFYELSKEALQSVDGLVSEEDKLSWINETLTTENVKESNYYTTYLKYYKLICEREPGNEDPELNRDNFRDISSFEVIPATILNCEGKKLCENSTTQQDSLPHGREIYNRVRNVFSNPKSTATEKALARDEMESITVSISGNAYKNAKYAQSTKYQPLEVTPYWRIPVVDYYYDEDIGLEIRFDTHISSQML